MDEAIWEARLNEAEANAAASEAAAFAEEELTPDIAPTEQGGFTVDDDAKAEWALKKILARRKERDRMLALVEAEIMRLTARRKAIEEACDNDTNWLEHQLRYYMDTVECRQLKTGKKYALLSGTLVSKKPTVDFKRDDEKIVKWLEGRGMYGMIQVVKKPSWAELKKLCEVSGDAVVLAGTGEVVDGVTPEEKEGQFVIEEAKA